MSAGKEDSGSKPGPSTVHSALEDLSSNSALHSGQADTVENHGRSSDPVDSLDKWSELGDEFPKFQPTLQAQDFSNDKLTPFRGRPSPYMPLDDEDGINSHDLVTGWLTNDKGEHVRRTRPSPLQRFTEDSIPQVPREVFLANKRKSPAPFEADFDWHDVALDNSNNNIRSEGERLDNSSAQGSVLRGPDQQQRDNLEWDRRHLDIDLEAGTRHLDVGREAGRRHMQEERERMCSRKALLCIIATVIGAFTVAILWFVLAVEVSNK
jgi:hypothetical protein